MIRKHIYIIIGACILCLSGCSNDIVEQPDTEQVPIVFSAMIPSVTVETHTRATDFPNSGQIAVVAANATETTEIGSTDWSSDNIYLNHLAATVGEKSGSIYPVTLSSIQYWPFDPDKYLSFVAYSPATHNSLTHSGTDLTVDITGKSYSFPDLLYTVPVGPFYKKSNYNAELGRAYLGEFKHAMAKLVVKVIAIDKDGNEVSNYNNTLFNTDVQVTDLHIETKNTAGTFQLTPTPEWNMFTPGTNYQKVYSFINSSTKLPYNKNGAVECYLFPGTVDNSQVHITVKDKTMTTPFTKEMADFPIDGSSPDTPVTLEMGKTTVLTIKLQFTDIPTANATMQLKGELTDWDYKGESKVTIE